ncbi:RNA polymerase beta subunit [Tanacetum coccineum]
MSKLDRFFISKGLMVSFPHLSAIYLDKHLSDHRPILMREMNIDYGPTPFRFFHSWFQLEGFDKLVEDTWMHMNITDSNGMIILKKKLQALKIIIREWTKNAKKCSYKKKSSIQSKLSDIDKIIDQGGSNEEVAQKVKVCWAIEGDENSKYFHGILNNKRSQLTIRGVLVNGDWIVEPKDLSLEQQVDLERTVSKEEIKRAVVLLFRFIDQGLTEELSKFPKIEDTNQEIDFELFLERYQLVEPLIKERDDVYESLTYSSELYVSARLIWKNDRRARLIWKNDRRRISVYTGTIISDWGGRLELEIDRKARIWVRVSRQQKLSILVLLSAMGLNIREILENVCYPELFLSFLNDKKKIGSKENAILEFYQQFACVEGDPVFSESLSKDL